MHTSNVVRSAVQAAAQTTLVAAQQAAATVQQVAVRQAFQTVQTSVVQQIGLVAHLSIQAIGYVAAQLRHLGGAPLPRIVVGDRVRHVVRLGEDYALDVGYQRAEPAGYQGARVEVVEAGEPTELDVVVDGAGIEISNGGGARLRIETGNDSRVTLRLRPTVSGPTRMTVDLYRGAGWSQRLDFDLDVRAGADVEKLEQETAAGQPQIIAAESITATNTLPTLSDAVPRHLHLRFDFATQAGRGRTYRAGAIVPGQRRPIENRLREDDLAEINMRLREGLDLARQQFGARIKWDAATTQSADYARTLETLAERGNWAYKLIFPQQADRDFVRQALAQNGLAQLEIGTDCFFLPWELLFDEYRPGRNTYAGFWGFRYGITRRLTDMRQAAAPLVAAAQPPRVALFADPELEQASKYEIPYFRKLHTQRSVQLWDWLDRPDDVGQTEHDRRYAFFRYAREHQSDVTHFACHAVASEQSNADSYLKLSDSLHVSVEDMVVGNYQLGGEPIVVLNACGTGVRDPRRTSDLVRMLMQCGARGVLATECDVPDIFAAQFIQQLYHLVLRGKTFSQALMATRLIYLQKWGNPLGLLYSAYLPPEARLLVETSIKEDVA